jgi:hypothetical protein
MAQETIPSAYLSLEPFRRIEAARSRGVTITAVNAAGDLMRGPNLSENSL